MKKQSELSGFRVKVHKTRTEKTVSEKFVHGMCETSTQAANLGIGHLPPFGFAVISADFSSPFRLAFVSVFKFVL